MQNRLMNPTRKRDAVRHIRKALDVSRSIPSTDVIATLDRRIAKRGAPAFIRRDNGPEFSAEAVQNRLSTLAVETRLISILRIDRAGFACTPETSHLVKPTYGPLFIKRSHVNLFTSHCVGVGDSALRFRLRYAASADLISFLFHRSPGPSLVNAATATEPSIEFRELVETHKKRVYYLALDLTGNHHDAEDLAQDVFIKAFRALDSFRGDAKVFTWLYRITVNTHLNRRHQPRRHREQLYDHAGVRPGRTIRARHRRTERRRSRDPDPNPRRLGESAVRLGFKVQR